MTENEAEAKMPGMKAGLNPEASDLYKFYAEVLPEVDFKYFLESFTQELPAVFRVEKEARNEAYEKGVSQLIEQIFSEHELCRLPVPKFAYEMDFSRRTLRSSETLNGAHKTIVALHESSFITREEFVSMLPPLFLEPQRDEKILDMCAAPGQKTQQILEAVGPNGLIVANDASLSRAHTLMHNLMDQPTTQLVITNLDATKLPEFPFKFDRILADVPCSGDGTLRKAPDVWRHWSLKTAFQLHQVQLGCLIRGLSLLKVGGRLVYSTCSMNFVENEAVVAWALREFATSVKVVSKAFDGVNSRSGFTEWPDLDKMPETARFAYDAAITEQLQATHRFYPWTAGSGGFYVAVLEKTAELDEQHVYVQTMRANVAKYQEENLSNRYCADENRRMPLHAYAKFEKKDVIDEIQREFAFSHIFEHGDAHDRLSNLLVRVPDDGTEPARLYLVNKHVSSIFNIEHANDVFHIVELGCGTFNRESGSDRGVIYRLESNVNFLLRNTRRVVEVTFEAFMKILDVGLGDFDGESPESILFDLLPQKEIARNLRDEHFVGEVLLKITDGEFSEFLSDFCISAWLGGNSIGIHMKKKARYALRCLLKQEMIDQLIISGQAKRKQAHKERRAAKQQAEKNAKKDDSL